MKKELSLMKFSPLDHINNDYCVNNWSTIEELDNIFKYYNSYINQDLIKISDKDYDFFLMSYAIIMLNYETYNPEIQKLIKKISYWYISDSYSSALSDNFIKIVFESYENMLKNRPF